MTVLKLAMSQINETSIPSPEYPGKNIDDI